MEQWNSCSEQQQKKIMENFSIPVDKRCGDKDGFVVCADNFYKPMKEKLCLMQIENH